MAEPEFDDVLGAIRDLIRPTPGLRAAHYPPPDSLGRAFPCAIVQATEGTIDIAGDETETEWWRHEVRVDVLLERDNLPARYPVVIRLVKAISRRFRANLQLGGLVNICQPVRYSVGGRTYMGSEWTGGTLILQVEEAYAVDLEP